MMGNRGGCFHTEEKMLKPTHWKTRQWITCVLKFKDRQRELMLLAGKLTTMETWLRFNNGDVDALRAFIDEGAEIIRVDDSFIAAANEATRAWEDRTAEELGGWFATVLASQRDFVARWETAPLYRSELR